MYQIRHAHTIDNKRIHNVVREWDESYGKKTGEAFILNIDTKITGVRLWGNEHLSAMQFQIDHDWKNKYGAIHTNDKYLVSLELDSDEYFMRAI